MVDSMIYYTLAWSRFPYGTSVTIPTSFTFRVYANGLFLLSFLLFSSLLLPLFTLLTFKGLIP